MTPAPPEPRPERATAPRPEPAAASRAVGPAGTRRCVLVLLTPVTWSPPGVDPATWRHALAEDVVDLLTTLAEVDVALAAPPGTRAVADAIRWPRMPVHDVPAATPLAALRAAAEAGYHQAVVLPPDAPDLPALILGKLFRPLTSRPVAAAPAEAVPVPDVPVGSGPPETGRRPPAGLVGLGATLPVAGWLAEHDPDLDIDSLATLRAAARTARASGPAAAPGWHRQRGPADLAALDPHLEGWEATRALLSGEA